MGEKKQEKFKEPAPGLGEMGMMVGGTGIEPVTPTMST